MEIINVTDEIIEINVTEEVINIQAPTGAYPFPNAVNSVFGRVGAIVAAEGDYNLTQLGDVTLTSPANGQVLKYNGTQWVNSTDADTGITTLNTLTALSQTFATGTSGTDFNISSATSTHTFNFPTASATNRGLLSSANWSNFNTAYNDSITSAAVTGTTTKTLTLNQQDGGTITASWTDINTDAVTSVFGRTGAVVATSGDYTTTQVTEGTNLYFTDARARAAITLTTTGTSGAATYSGGTLNIPQYQGVLTNPVTGTGTTNTLPKFTAASTIGNSNITDNGSLITLGSNSFVNGSLFVGANNPNGWTAGLVTSSPFTGGTSVFGNVVDGTIQSGVTANATYFRSQSATAAAAFTLTNIQHYWAVQGTFGAGSSVVTQRGFWAGASLIGATNNYAFQGSIPSGTNRWNLYMDGTAANYLAGQLLIGTTTTSAFALDVNGDARVSNSVFYKLFGTSANYYRVGILAGTANFEIFNTNIGRTDLLITQSTGAATFSNSVTAASFIPTSSTIPTNGMYLSGTNTLGFATNSTLDMVINEVGSVGIGTTSINARLESALSTSNGVSVSLRITNSSAASTSPGQGVQMDFVNDNGFNASVSSSAIRSITTSTANGGADLLFLNYNGSALTEYMRISRLGSVGIGTTSLTGFSLRVAKNITGATSGIGISQGGIIQSDVTSGWGYYNSLSTAAATFTIGTYRHYFTEQGTLGAGSVITIQTGFEAGSSLIGGTNNYGFRGAIPSGTNRWNLFMDGTANNYMAGSLGIGNTSLDSTMLRISRAFTSTLTNSVFLDSQVSSTNPSANYISTSANTQAATFTTQIRHINLTQGTFGAGSTVTDQFGIIVGNLTGATNNYGFFGNISAAANRWNLYMDGSANNYMAGSLGIGSTSLTGVNLYINKNITGATTAYGILNQGTIQSDATTQVFYYRSFALTQAAAFTLGVLNHYTATLASIGAGSSITEQNGFNVDNTIIGATNNYGFRGRIPAGTNRWNLYMDGTAANYMAGSLGIGSTVIETKLDIDISSTSTSVAFGNSIKVENTNTTVGNISALMLSQAGDAAATIAGIHTSRTAGSRTSDLAFYSYQQSGSGITERVRVKSTGQMRFVPLASDPSGAEAGDVYYNSTTNKLKVYNGTTWETITSA
jgi:hypothetical protein